VAAVIGAVRSLHRWPVKSAGGEALQATWLDTRGLAGDRAHALFIDGKRGRRVPLTAREAPRLLAWSASYRGEEVPLDDPPLPLLTDPHGHLHPWGTEVLGEDLGRSVAFVRDTHGLADLRDSVLITVDASHRAVESHLGAELDLCRWRTNLHLQLDLEPFAEERWEGRVLRVGDATFDLLHPCARCVIPTRDPRTQRKNPDLLRWLARERHGRFGINARARGRARVMVGDPVVLV
jgi:uncharacterized protein YcbX